MVKVKSADQSRLPYLGRVGKINVLRVLHQTLATAPQVVNYF